MKAKHILETLNFGASVAEHDNDLREYFVQTATFKELIAGTGDIVAGDKGTGKSAIYRILKESYREYEDLDDVELVDSFNLHGNPVFQRLVQTEGLTEGDYRTVWKSYVLSLVGNWLLEVYPDDFNDQTRELAATLEHLDLRSNDPAPMTVFSRLVGLIGRLRSAETQFTFTETGMPVVVPKVVFGHEVQEGAEIYCDDFLQTLSNAVSATGYRLWVLFDRLDEAFAGQPEVEVPALRALLRTYLDLVGLPGIELKLFLRRDLFRRIIQGGFVNLSHINSRTIEIVWDDEDLWSMIQRRVGEAAKYKELFVDCELPEDLIGVLLPEQIDVGEKQSTSQKWILNRVRDGNNVKPPRSVIDILNDTKAAQIRKESRDSRDLEPEVGPYFEAQSVKRAFVQLSEKRVQDTLLAEAGEFAPFVEKFRDGKAEHNKKTLMAVLDAGEGFLRILQGLLDLGFLEQEGEIYKVPMLYRSGLGITQGKAY